MHPIIGYANEHQANPRAFIRYSRVQSVMLLWCKAGRGRVTVNGVNYPLPSGSFLVLPWNHAISYHPDIEEPFLVAGVHLVPDYPPGQPLPLSVVHDAADLADEAALHGAGMPPLCTTTLQGTWADAPQLHLLADYIVAWSQRGQRPEGMARRLGELLVEELRLAVDGMRAEAIPPRLERVLAYARQHLAERITLAELAEEARSSRSTVTRLFARHLQRSPTQWLLEARMERAAHLLSTTGSPIGQVGRQVGIDDPYYFSRLFHRYYTLTPTAYRQQSSLIR